MTIEYQLEQTLPLGEIVNDLAFSPDGALLVVATRGKTASTLIYQLSDWSLRPAPRFVRYCLAFCDDGRLVVAGSSVERFALGAPKIGKSELSIEGHKKGITRVEVSPDGRWIAVHKYLEALELWFVGDGAPVKCRSFSAYSTGRYFFRADSGGFWFLTSEYVASRYVQKIHQVALGPRGENAEPVEIDLPEGLGFHDEIAPTAHGLVAITFPEQDVVIYDWDSLTPRALGVKELVGLGIRGQFSVSPDGAFAVVQVRKDTDGSPSEWLLFVVSLPEGQVVATLALGRVSAGLLKVAPHAARIACSSSDGSRVLRVFARRVV